MNVDEDVLRANREKRSPNLEESSEYVINPRGQKLSVRTALPPAGVAVRGYVLFLHGYCAHGSRPVHTHLTTAFTSAGYGYITLDFHGHGRSEGERAVVRDAWDLVDDALCLVLALHGDDATHLQSAQTNRLLGAQSSLRTRIPTASAAPLYLLGHSMGGGAAILVGAALRRGGAPTAFGRENAAALQRIARSFGGAMLFCPLIDINLPPILKHALLTPLLCCCPGAALPAFLSNSVGASDKIWATQTYRDYCASDQWPANPAGLSYGGRMHLSTLHSLMSMSELVLALLPDVCFPFVIFHDPEDQVCRFAGSLRAKALAQSKHKEVQDMPNTLHDVLANDLHGSVSRMLRWLAERGGEHNVL